MAAARSKQKAHRKKMLDAAKSSVTLKTPVDAAAAPIREKIKVSAKSTRSALIAGEGRSMGMEID